MRCKCPNRHQIRKLLDVLYMAGATMLLRFSEPLH
jgi:hypothetical protein